MTASPPISRLLDKLSAPAIHTPELWQDAIISYKRMTRQQEERANRALTYTEPTALAFLSDTHFGNPATDHAAALQDAYLIRDTPGMRAIFHGDGIDNWIPGKLQGLQRGQSVPFANELALFKEWLTILLPKLDVVVSGNHDLWTLKTSGLDLIPALIPTHKMIYDRYQAYIRLTVGASQRRLFVRHKWRGNSIYNPTHGLEVGYERMGYEYDIAVGGHTHIGTLFRDFIRMGERRIAVLTGTYKHYDAFGEEIGFAPTAHNGCGAIVFHPDGRMLVTSDLATARDVLYLWRLQYAKRQEQRDLRG